MVLQSSELILNTDGSVYHLNLLPEDIADTIILVGDPNRVSVVSKYFDYIDVKKSKREFVTHTGVLNKKRITVVGTGIGAGNIDIALNELDALVNIDFQTRTIKEKIKKLQFIRLGTAGALHAHTPVDSLVISSFAVGLDGMVSYYNWESHAAEAQLLSECHHVFSKAPISAAMYVASGASSLISAFAVLGTVGITLTCPGFYGAQNRQLRAPLSPVDLFSLIKQIQFRHQLIINLEMETAAIYGMSRLLNHDACSISVIAANRETKTFSKNVDEAIDRMIKKSLDIIVELLPFSEEFSSLGDIE
ncbi:MAG: hypothetical protein A3I77_04630 [Gammaproteobacteria bacterium RIFCSPLOWO2_02_FULL_42_14]|nr:MAG: hypothetical protein A3B71_05930 [Gammaproteobacteria bacterium RIFCSPHIGHO2_02_FULL_42_43]OGT51525.1 MAG: hypothetical protein A3E54_05695 [Gammaproteobacteria bacterium RIFCSPHIGHO2_12_FULL_41_25]OGT62226.1 MAG: hypothetical protein A3I77_04630 [Gammaproteobacteria bacterium RIFCSPLOWO2_02_FULL_42_14]OGT85899.1 MAG: hypothetical protein A3G86_04320 [Gammaproteobacteria bacterium RIFCSPLOWO2_12_FULL_42_18]